MRHEANKEYERQLNDWRIENAYSREFFKPYGNPGPGMIGTVVAISRDKEQCSFKWGRDRERTKWIPNPDDPYYMMPDPSKINAHYKCPTHLLLNVDAYTPGDYKIFFNDPRTRMNYLKWAPLLLSAEDWHAGRRVDAEDEEFGFR